MQKLVCDATVKAYTTHQLHYPKHRNGRHCEVLWRHLLERRKMRMWWEIGILLCDWICMNEHFKKVVNRHGTCQEICYWENNLGVFLSVVSMDKYLSFHWLFASSYRMPCSRSGHCFRVIWCCFLCVTESFKINVFLKDTMYSFQEGLILLSVSSRASVKSLKLTSILFSNLTLKQYFCEWQLHFPQLNVLYFNLRLFLDNFYHCYYTGEAK